MDRKNIASGAPWEATVGYSRVVRIGPFVYVAGTTAVDGSGQVVGAGDAYKQTKYIFQKIEGALAKVGTGMRDVVRTRMYVINVDDWEQIGKAHGEFFGEIRPVATLVEVSRLIGPEFLVEIEVDAVMTTEVDK